MIEKRLYALSRGASPEEGRERRGVGRHDVDGVSLRVPMPHRPLIQMLHSASHGETGRLPYSSIFSLVLHLEISRRMDVALPCRY